MMLAAQPQMSLFRAHASPSGEESASQSVRLALILDHREWLEFLVDEWWSLTAETPLRLWPSAPRRLRDHGDKIAIIAWLDPAKLPSISVLTKRGAGWVSLPLSEVAVSDEQVLWNGPVPLFAVSSFSVATEEDRRRILAMAKGFSNVPPPAQPVNVEPVELKELVQEEDPAPSGQRLAPPRTWNAARGAAAMALWAVPNLEPWMQLLCRALRSEIDPTLGTAVGAPWWAEPPWIAPLRRVPARFPLWQALIETMMQFSAHSWRPAELLGFVAEHALAKGADQREIHDLIQETRAILRDDRPVTEERAARDPVGLALQLVLLRPDPGRFVEWRRDFKALPPGVWWMGATLSGALCGYRDLEPPFRGSLQGQRFLALHTWQRQSGPSQSAWSSTLPDPQYEQDRNQLRLIWEGEVIREVEQHPRGAWLQVSLNDPRNREGAIALAKHRGMPCFRRIAQVSGFRLAYRGGVGLDAAPGGGTLAFEEGSILELPEDIRLVDELDEDKFRNWLVMGGIEGSIPAPPAPLVSIDHAPAPRVAIVASEARDESIPGLRMVCDFITADEETSLVAEVDRAPWSSELARRVQHYGWKYNYKARSIEGSDYLGPLPAWAAGLATRLLEQGLVEELPDQVIVNEYLGKQGISKHTDCVPCFRGAIAMISLVEPWEMNFWPPKGEKESRVLPSRSVTILSGIVRDRWKHEIPARKREPGGLRGRRVSLTFRKVVSASPGLKSK